MSDFESIDPPESDPAGSAPIAASGPSVTGSAGVPRAEPPGPPVSGPDELAPVSTAKHARRPRFGRLSLTKRSRWIVAAVLMCSVLGLSVGLIASSSATAEPPVSGSTPTSGLGSGAGGSNARSGPASGGASGTVEAVSASGFTITTSAGQKVTVEESTSTTYEKGQFRPQRVPLRRANPSSCLGPPAEPPSRPPRSSWTRPTACLRLPPPQR